MAIPAKKTPSISFYVFGITVCLWAYSFHVFLTRQAPLTSDAVSFYDHLKFYIDSITRGVYPLWDPLWSSGAPNEFFLRRIGPFNPFLVLIAVPYKLGVGFWPLFSGFVTFYFFLGMLGFYRLARVISRDEFSALLAFVLLSLSSLGTRVFDSYIMMFMTPMIWFFYFLITFGQAQKRHAFLGMVFCVMLLMTTYIPFYFITIVLSFFIFFTLVYPKQAVGFVVALFRFMVRNPAVSLLSLAGLALCCVPGYLFFKSASQGTFTLPLRHFDAQHENVLSVKAAVTSYWAMPEDLVYSTFYTSDLRLFDFAAFYLPLTAYILLLLGLAARLNRKIVLMFLWGFFFLLLGSPHLTPLYQFLHDRIFFFKYFRNLHFFLWLVIMPLFVLFVVEQLKDLLDEAQKGGRVKLSIFCSALLAHLAVAAALIWQDSMNYSTWIAWLVSLAAFFLYFWSRLSRDMFLAVLLFATVVQPLEAYHYLSKSWLKVVEVYLTRNALTSLGLSEYDRFSSKFEYTRGEKVLLPAARVKNEPLYFGTQWYTALWDNMDANVLRNYTHSKFILYDRVLAFDDQKEDIRVIEQAWEKGLNVAFVPADSPVENLEGSIVTRGPAMTVSGPTQQLRVIRYNANQVRLKTDLSAKKFLVFNDSYFPGWRVFIDGKEGSLYRANIAFKGVWVPAGDHVVEFRFGEAKRSAIEIFLLVFYCGLLVLLVWSWRKDILAEKKWLEGVRDV